MINIRKATLKDLDNISKLESICFPPEQSASKERLKNRLDVFASQFLVAEKDDTLVGYIGGMASNDKFITDIMYENPQLHTHSGKYQMIFSLVVHPNYRNNHIATLLMQEMIELAKSEHRFGISLTCLDSMISFYENMGFINFGVSQSTHGDTVWYNMLKILNPPKESLNIDCADISQLDEIKSLIDNAITKTFPLYYPAGASDLFLHYHNRENISKDINNKNVYVLQVDNIILGTITIENNNHIGRFFVLPQCQKRGYGNMLMDFVENKIFEVYDTISLRALLPAKSLYLKRGFKEVEYHASKTHLGDYLCFSIMTKTI